MPLVLNRYAVTGSGHSAGVKATSRTCSPTSQSFLSEAFCEMMETLLAAHSISQKSFP